jgi:hypothetical protein
MLPFNNPKIFTLSPKLSKFTFALLLGASFNFGEADFHKTKDRE